ncbi:MAG: hypothetical protein WAO71_04130 [Gallionella sp.]
MTKPRKKNVKNSTSVKTYLKEESALRFLVLKGLGAVEKSHHDYFDNTIRNDFVDSLDLDKAMLEGHEQENRWDYLLGHEPSGKVVALEPHSAEQGEIKTVIKKRDAAKRHLQEHKKEDVDIAKWLWVASGKVHFLAIEKTTFALSEKGIEFVGSKVRAKHLPEGEKLVNRQAVLKAKMKR